MAESFRIERLTGSHNRSRFVSGSDALDQYFRQQVTQDSKRRIATCFVAVSVETNEVAAFYTLAAASIPLELSADEVKKRLPRYPVVPAALVGRLAVASSYQGRGLGGVILADAVMRVSRAEMGVFGLIVDAKDGPAQRFYERFGFVLLPGEGRRLMIPVATALRRLEGQLN